MPAPARDLPMSKSLVSLVSTLQQFAVFKPVPHEQLHWLVSRADHCQMEAGAYIFREGDAIDKMVVLLQGNVTLMLSEEAQGTLREWGPGDITGALPFSRAEVAHAAIKARQATELLSLPTTFFPEMIQEKYELTEVLVHTMTSRVRKFTHSQEQTEKMEALGKLAAGLTHELNNPASATSRNAAGLQKQLTALPGLLQQLCGEKAPGKLLAQIENLIKFSTEKGTPTSSPGLLERTGKENEIARWLEKHQVGKPYDLAQSFSEQQIGIAELEQLEKAGSDKQLQPSLRVLALFLSMHRLADDIQFSSSRISRLVNAVKTYTHLDKSPEKEKTNIHTGIRNTLTMLNFKLRKRNIRLHTCFSDNLPEACVYSGELNQLWTNLIDNAIDAMNSGGFLRISTSREEEWIKVVIKDTGEGIPPESQQQVFEPFFTTKKAGEGSGMGLDIVRRIVEHHEGKIELESEKGRTCFRVFLPA